MIPYLFIIIGVWIYYAAYGWTLATTISLNLFWTGLFLLIGLALILKKPRI